LRQKSDVSGRWRKLAPFLLEIEMTRNEIWMKKVNRNIMGLFGVNEEYLSEARRAPRDEAFDPPHDDKL